VKIYLSIRRVIALIVFLFVCNKTNSQIIAIIADRLIDGKSDEAKADPTIIINGSKIVEINFTNSIPAGARIIRLKGYTILPGLIDVHTHLLADGADYDKDLYNHSPSYRALRAVKYLSISLNNGFTTIRDVCSEGAGFADIDLSSAVDSGFIDGPQIVASGKGIAATGWYLPFPMAQNWELLLPSGTQQVTGKNECVKAVREQVTHGVKWIKLFADWATPTFSFEEMKTIVDEAKKYHVDVAAHATTKSGIKMAIEAGVRSIEHGNGFDDSLIDLAIQHNVYWSPTITVNEYFGSPMDSCYKYLNRAYGKKLKIVLGTDIGSFPWIINESTEISYYVNRAGLKPMDAIKTGTSNAAELLGLDKTIGRIEKKYTANIIAVKGNPLEQISVLQQVGFVMKEGRIIKQPTGE
jgi:imidazolonepropionase-like amidohydrolase